MAALLKDAGITAVFTTQYKRSKQTAEPLAKALGVTVAEVDSRDLVGLLDRMKKSSGNVLIVGHTNTIPETIKAPVPTESNIAEGSARRRNRVPTAELVENFISWVHWPSRNAILSPSIHSTRAARVENLHQSFDGE